MMETMLFEMIEGVAKAMNKAQAVLDPSDLLSVMGVLHELMPRNSSFHEWSCTSPEMMEVLRRSHTIPPEWLQVIQAVESQKVASARLLLMGGDDTSFDTLKDPAFHALYPLLHGGRDDCVTSENASMILAAEAICSLCAQPDDPAAQDALRRCCGHDFQDPVTRDMVESISVDGLQSAEQAEWLTSKAAAVAKAAAV